MRTASTHQCLPPEWDHLICRNPDGGNVAHGRVLAHVKTSYGWRIRHFVSRSSAGGIAVTVWERSIFGLGNLWYVPKGPGVTDTETLRQVCTELMSLARRHRVFVMKVEPELIATPETIRVMDSIGRRAGAVQPNKHTVVYAVPCSEEAAFSSLPKRTRNAISRARREGITVRPHEFDGQGCDLMLGLMKETQRTHGAAIPKLREDKYYRQYWQAYARAEQARLYFAWWQDRIVAGAVILCYGEKATYKDGGSTQDKPVYGAAQALQWAVITDLIRDGNIRSYDLCGAPPSHRVNDTDHPLWGIGNFKLGFGKAITDYVGVYDIVVAPLRYAVWHIAAERLIRRVWGPLTGYTLY